MKKIALLSLLSALSLSPAFADDGDLVLPGERWLATFDKYVCAAFSPAVARPSALDQYNVVFDRLTTDQTLDNALLKATFEENGKACRYSAILLADNDAQDSRLVQSKAFSADGEADCAGGKAVLDAAFAHNDYLYYGHPHNLAFMLPGVGSEAICGDRAQFIGVNFVVRGRIVNNPTL